MTNAERAARHLAMLQSFRIAPTRALLLAHTDRCRRSARRAKASHRYPATDVYAARRAALLSARAFQTLAHRSAE